ncbi:metallophosphoesterase [Bacillus massiliigorillae]|uniref:metallophosphoesterase n=1 Tax=Bacillus massiliigorillae TaxID=1243664 RepID=UPI00039FB469|nr:metallophosphoesterase [Bacillus massiliigorillae]
MLYIFLGCIFVLMLFALYMLKLANENRVVEHDLQFEEFPNSFGTVQIYFISDIHRRIVNSKMIRSVKADFVIVGGDLAEKNVPFERIKENIKKLKTIGPVYFVWGNNDYELDYHELDATLLDLGVKILDNTAVVFESGNGDKLSLLGVDYVGSSRDRLDLALLDSAESSFKILVSHCPRIIRKIETKHRISLVLAGHTHGGQVRFLGFGPYKLGGLQSYATTKMLTSNGYGTSLLPLRLGARAETHLITISSSDPEK